MRLGVFLCTCSKSLNIDFKHVKKDIEAVVVEINDVLCQDEGLAYIIDDIRRKKLDTLVVGCSIKRHVFERLLEERELLCDLITINLREHCGLVHSRKEATLKAKRMIWGEIAKAENAPLKFPFTIEVGDEILLIGSPPLAAEIGKSLARIAEVKLLAESFELSEPEVEIHTGSLKGIAGEFGNFVVTVEKGPIDMERCIMCGKCEAICPKHAISLAECKINDNCDSCGKCIKACSFKAILLGGGTEKIKAGQILIFDSPPKLSKKGIYYIHGESEIELLSSALKASLLAASNLGRVRDTNFLEVNLESCAWGKSGIEGCHLCIDTCPHGAIERRGDTMHFSEVSCMGCGSCVSVCPISIPRLREFGQEILESQIRAMLTGGGRKVVMFTCLDGARKVLDAAGREKISYPPVLPVFVPCVNAVSDFDILRAIDLGADGIIIFGCSNCRHKSSSVSIAVGFANSFLEALYMGRRMIKIDADDPAEFVSLTTEFYSSLTQIPHGSPAQLDNGDKRREMLEVMRNLRDNVRITPDIVIEGKEYPFGVPKVDPTKCTLCNTCTVMCPTEAIKKEEDRLVFLHAMCIACELCEKSCPENAIELKRKIDFSKLLDNYEDIISSAKMVHCPGCGMITWSENAYLKNMNILKTQNSIKHPELLKYCENCKPMKVMELLKNEKLE